MKTDEALIILTQTYDLLAWLLPRCDDFPRSQRFAMTQRLQAAAFEFAEALYLANALHTDARLAALRKADAHLNALRLYLRLAHDWEWLGHGQFEHVSRMVADIGKLLGGWIRQTRSPNKSGAPRAASGQAEPQA